MIVHCSSSSFSKSTTVLWRLPGVSDAIMHAWEPPSEGWTWPWSSEHGLPQSKYVLSAVLGVDDLSTLVGLHCQEHLIVLRWHDLSPCWQSDDGALR
jgi:hypothetical protein